MRILTEHLRRQKREHDAVRRPVAFEDLTLDDLLLRVSSHLFPHLFLRLSECQSLRLSEEVGQEDPMVLRVMDGIVGRGRGDEVSRNDLGSLMKELIERVLSVRARCTPNDRLEKERLTVRPRSS